MVKERQRVKEALDNPIVFAVLLVMILFPLSVMLQWVFTSLHWGGASQALGG